MWRSLGRRGEISDGGDGIFFAFTAERLGEWSPSVSALLCAGRTSSGEQRRYIMSNNQKERFETFQCDSRYQECELCLVKIPYKELMKGTPSTEVPLEGWTNKRCYPDCTQAAEDRKQRTPAPVPPGGVPPKTLPFRTTSSFNVCGACNTFIELGAWVTATRVDVPYGQFLRRWHDFYHHNGCPPPVSPSSVR